MPLRAVRARVDSQGRTARHLPEMPVSILANAAQENPLNASLILIF